MRVAFALTALAATGAAAAPLTAASLPSAAVAGATSMTVVDPETGAMQSVLGRSRRSGVRGAPAAEGASVRDTSKGFKQLHETNLAESIYTDSELSQPSGAGVYYTASAGSNGAPPKTVQSAQAATGTVAWTRSGTDAHTASHAGTTATLECDLNPARTGTNCTVYAIDTQTGQVKWSNLFNDAIPADHVSIAVTTDGAHIAVALTEFAPPLPSSTFHSAMKLYSTHSGTPIAVHNGANMTQVRDVAVADDYVAVVSQDSVDVYSIPHQQLAFSEKFDFSSGTMCIAPDGSAFAYGFENVYLWKRVSGSGLSYTQAAVFSMSQGGDIGLAGTCVMSKADLAVAYYTTSMKQNIVALYDTQTAKAKWQYNYPADTGSIYQNLPVSSAFAADGSHFVVGAWGSSNQTSPTVAAFSTSITHPIAELTTVGSIFSVDIHRDAANGNVLVSASGKAVHANKMGYGGILRILEVDHPTAAVEPAQQQRERVVTIHATE